MEDKFKIISDINLNKLCARLYAVRNYRQDNLEYKFKEKSDRILSGFFTLYPKSIATRYDDIYLINGEDAIKEYTGGEYESPNMPYYEELLTLNNLLVEHFGYSIFRTMVGQIYYCTKYPTLKYKVIYIEQVYRLEQLFILQRVGSKELREVYVDEWDCSKLNNVEWSPSKTNMLKYARKQADKEHKEILERLHRIEEGVYAT